MSIFEPITLEWRGKQHVIAADRVMRAIALIEDHVTLLELQRAAMVGSAPLAKISHAFAAVINYAGGSLKAEEVYAGMFGDGDDAAQVQLAVVTLLAMMVPPNASGGSIEKKSSAAAPSSVKRTKRPIHGGSNRPNSGG